ncbi:hypothetical protein NDU88_008156 [Pleurodeles waltl]|uniref:Uncharacterized protein n=1 Tax=Pleurodeles waltl TaxID=8319 RepID=A0AAV7VRR6_PLEWA|nr:hypothetical protein NDU88_008156 [Pleurodeles waltl]
MPSREAAAFRDPPWASRRQREPWRGGGEWAATPIDPAAVALSGPTQGSRSPLEDQPGAYGGQRHLESPLEWCASDLILPSAAPISAGAYT